MPTPREELLRAWQGIRSIHREAIGNIVADLKAGRITPEEARIDIRSVTQASRVPLKVLYDHHLISEEAYNALAPYEKS